MASGAFLYLLSSFGMAGSTGVVKVLRRVPAAFAGMSERFLINTAGIHPSSGKRLKRRATAGYRNPFNAVINASGCSLNGMCPVPGTVTSVAFFTFLRSASALSAENR